MNKLFYAPKQLIIEIPNKDLGDLYKKEYVNIFAIVNLYGDEDNTIELKRIIAVDDANDGTPLPFLKDKWIHLIAINLAEQYIREHHVDIIEFAKRQAKEAV